MWVPRWSVYFFSWSNVNGLRYHPTSSYNLEIFQTDKTEACKRFTALFLFPFMSWERKKSSFSLLNSDGKRLISGEEWEGQNLTWQEHDLLLPHYPPSLMFSEFCYTWFSSLSQCEPLCVDFKAFSHPKLLTLNWDPLKRKQLQIIAFLFLQLKSNPE